MCVRQYVNIRLVTNIVIMMLQEKSKQNKWHRVNVIYERKKMFKRIIERVTYKILRTQQQNLFLSITAFIGSTRFSNGLH